MTQANNELKDFYAEWYHKTKEEIEYDINASAEKCKAAHRLLDAAGIGRIDSILEIGCGYGRNLLEMSNYTKASLAVGQDISGEAIDFANKHYSQNTIRFMHTESLDIKETVNAVIDKYPQRFDLVILFDVLEHIPDPKSFIREIARITDHFFIILPLEDSLLSRYLLGRRKKRFSGELHPDGHFYKFNINNVVQFIESLGTKPLTLDFCVHSLRDIYPDHLRPVRIGNRFTYELLKVMNGCARLILPKLLLLKLMGGGFFVCLVSYQKDIDFIQVVKEHC